MPPPVLLRSVVYVFVCICLHAKTVKPIKMPFGVLTRVRPIIRKHYGIQIPTGNGNFGEDVKITPQAIDGRFDWYMMR